MIKKWTLLEEEDVTPSSWFPLKRHVVRLPNNSIVDDYYIAPFGESVMIFPLTKEGEVVLVRQYKHGLAEIVMEFPAGFRQAGKTVRESAVAELREECGIVIPAEELEFVGRISNNPTKTDQVTHCFFARNLVINGTQKLDPTEHIEVLKVKPAQLLQMVTGGEFWVSDSLALLLKIQLLYPRLFAH